MASDPSVSVVVPAYNAARTIGATVQSALRQTHRDLELLIVDDASTDGTREAALDAAGGDARLRYARLPVNSGRPANPRNEGIRLARAPLVAFLDSDDLWSPHKLHDQVTVMQRHPDLVFVYSIAWSFTDARTVGDRIRALAEGLRLLRPFPTKPSLTLAELRERNTVTCSTVMARTEALRAIGGFDETPEMRCLEDFDLWLRLAASGPFGFVPRLHAYYRIHPGSSSKDPRGSNVPYLCEKHGLPMYPPSPRRAPWVAASRGLLSTAVMRTLGVAERAGRARGGAVPLRRA